VNVVVLTHKIPYPPNKGEKIRTWNQLDYLRKNGFNVSVVAALHSSEDEVLAQQYVAESGIKVIAERVRFNKLRMLVGLLKLRAFSVSNFYSGALQRRLDRHLGQNKVDIIFCTSSAMAEYVYCSGASNRGLLRKIMDFMDLDSDKWRQYSELNGFPLSLIYKYEEKMLSAMERRIQRDFETCLFISKNEVVLFQSMLGDAARNLRVVGNGVDQSVFRPDPDSHERERRQLVFSGVMDYFPNVNAMAWFMEQVWPLVKADHPDVQLTIAGMNPVSQVLAMAEDPDVTVTGFVEDIIPYFHRADIFIAPFQIARGVQNKILQAFACGIPVVSTSLGAEGIDCRDGHDVLLASSAEAFARAIDRLIREPECYESIRQTALTLVNEKYTWSASNEVLHRLMANGGELPADTTQPV